MLRWLAIGGVFLACGLGQAQAQSPPEIGDAVRAERVVLQLEPGQVTKAYSRHGFRQVTAASAMAYVDGKELPDVHADGRRFEFAGRGAYVVVTMPRSGPAQLRAVALRKVRLTVYLEWAA